jgi:hypothetical protein
MASELNAVVLNSPRINKDGALRVLPNDFGVDLEKYGVNVRFYCVGAESSFKREAEKSGVSPEDFKKRLESKFELFDKSFIDALAKAKLLYVTQYSGGAMTYIASKSEYVDAIKEFLKNGGTLFLDLFAVQPGSAKFFAECKIAYPWPTHKEYSKRNKGSYEALPNHALAHSLLNFPNKIKGRQKACDSYPGIPASQAPIFIKENSSGLPAMLLKEKALGKGRIIFCQIPAFFRNPSSNPEAGKMLENILSYVFNVDIRKEALRKMQDDGGPGEDI